MMCLGFGAGVQGLGFRMKVYKGHKSKNDEKKEHDDDHGNGTEYGSPRGNRNDRDDTN